jgi:hypothetical protein
MSRVVARGIAPSVALPGAEGHRAERLEAETIPQVLQVSPTTWLVRRAGFVTCMAVTRPPKGLGSRLRVDLPKPPH